MSNLPSINNSRRFGILPYPCACGHDQEVHSAFTDDTGDPIGCIEDDCDCLEFEEEV